jgi:hypothetical protein
VRMQRCGFITFRGCRNFVGDCVRAAAIGDRISQPLIA